MNCDNIIADFAALIESSKLQFRKTETEGVSYYYAENELYLVIDGRCVPNVFSLVRARSPEAAIADVTCRVLVGHPDSMQLKEENKPTMPLPKPPLGLIPRFIRDSERASEILEALGRYNDAGKPVPQEWLNELCERIRKEESK